MVQAFLRLSRRSLEVDYSCQRVLIQLSEDMGDGAALMHRHGACYAMPVDRKHFSTDMVHPKLRQLLLQMACEDTSKG